MFAETYENLLNGWRTINDFENQENPTTSPATLITAAEGITQRLCNIKAANSLKTVEGDQGASYLATSAAIFYLWADHRAQFACLVEQDQGICDREYYPAVHLDKGRDLVWEFMSSTARQFAEANLKATKGARIQGAPRFAEYYLILEKNINERASKARAANRRGKAFVVTARAKACVEGM
ncbi:MAG: hypothetical protein GTO40_06285 [Deltaproteobacteria bacterium]|nr:hypothetical protein [Deltaproteobacteria bacterium]